MSADGFQANGEGAGRKGKKVLFDRATQVVGRDTLAMAVQRLVLCLHFLAMSGPVTKSIE